jgi:hypothetical protein
VLDHPAELDRQARRREQRRDRQRRHRQRLADGRLSVAVDVGCNEVDMLVRLRWLPDQGVHDRDQIGAAIGRLLADSARR